MRYSKNKQLEYKVVDTCAFSSISLVSSQTATNVRSFGVSAKGVWMTIVFAFINTFVDVCKLVADVILGNGKTMKISSKKASSNLIFC